jgi:hypothetical protein
VGEMHTTNDVGRSRDVVDQTSARFGLRRQTGFSSTSSSSNRSSSVGETICHAVLGFRRVTRGD